MCEQGVLSGFRAARTLLAGLGISDTVAFCPSMIVLVGANSVTDGNQVLTHAARAARALVLLSLGLHNLAWRCGPFNDH